MNYETPSLKHKPMFYNKPMISASREVITTTFTGFYFQCWDLFLLHKEVIQSYSTDVMPELLQQQRGLIIHNQPTRALIFRPAVRLPDSRAGRDVLQVRELLVLAYSSECYLKNTTHQPLGSFKITFRLPSPQCHGHGQPRPPCAHVRPTAALLCCRPSSQLVPYLMHLSPYLHLLRQKAV